MTSAPNRCRSPLQISGIRSSDARCRMRSVGARTARKPRRASLHARPQIHTDHLGRRPHPRMPAPTSAASCPAPSSRRAPPASNSSLVAVPPTTPAKSRTNKHDPADDSRTGTEMRTHGGGYPHRPEPCDRAVIVPPPRSRRSKAAIPCLNAQHEHGFLGTPLSTLTGRLPLPAPEVKRSHTISPGFNYRLSEDRRQTVRITDGQ